jgi:hypothetical protein
MSAMIFTKDGNMWIDVSSKAGIIWGGNLSILYELIYTGMADDYMVGPIETESQLREAQENPDSIICVQAEKHSSVPSKSWGWETAEKRLIDGHWWVKVSDVQIK